MWIEDDLAGDASYFVTIYSVHHVQFFPLHECVLIDFESWYARSPCPVVPNHYCVSSHQVLNRFGQD